MDRELSILFRHHTEVEALRVKQLTKDPSFAVEGGKLVFDKIDCSVSGMHPPDNWAGGIKARDASGRPTKIGSSGGDLLIKYDQNGKVVDLNSRDSLIHRDAQSGRWAEDIV